MTGIWSSRSERNNGGDMKTSKIERMDRRIREMHRLAVELKEEGRGIQAVERNVDRILASLRMLELNISDVNEILQGKSRRSC